MYLNRNDKCGVGRRSLDPAELGSIAIENPPAPLAHPLRMERIHDREGPVKLHVKVITMARLVPQDELMQPGLGSDRGHGFVFLFEVRDEFVRG
jgi:hypothetical protein